MAFQLLLEMVSKPPMPSATADNDGLNGEPRLVAREAAADGGRHG
jgi:hypothetical protein